MDIQRKNNMKYKLNQNVGICGTSLRGYIVLSPAALVRKFGRSWLTDNYKQSGEYVFESDSGEVITLYDWKATTLYGESNITPDELWSMEKPFEFNIGGRPTIDLDGFIQWLLNEIK